jgi:hypothetical protein
VLVLGVLGRRLGNPASDAARVNAKALCTYTTLDEWR